jgi:hypothetical protein
MRGCAGDGFVGEENLRRLQFNAVNHDGLRCCEIAEVVTYLWWIVVSASGPPAG